MNKFKDFIKKHLGAIGVGTVLFLIVGVICFVIGAYLSGWDIFSWFISTQAFFVYGFLIVLLLIAISLWWYSYINKEE